MDTAPAFEKEGRTAGQEKTLDLGAAVIDSLTVIIRGKASGKIVLPKGGKLVPMGMDDSKQSFETRATFRSVAELRKYLTEIVEELKDEEAGGSVGASR